jgi:hypothetical protein
MIDFVETHVEFILEFLHVLFPLDGESFWPRNSTHPVMNNEAWLKVHFYKESELQKHLVLLPDGYYSSAKRIPHRGEKAHEGTQE